MRSVDKPIGLVEAALIASIEQTLAFVDHDERLRVLAVLLIYYMQGQGNAVTFEAEDWRLLCIGPGQPAVVTVHEHRILDIWREHDYDDLSIENQ